MLFTKVVSPQLLSTLRQLMELEELKAFSLGGGTSLALRFAHRSSIDIDLFTLQGFDSQACLEKVSSTFPGSDCLNRTKGSLCLSIQGVKIDILHHDYPLIGIVENIERIRLLSVEDVVAMKINAVTNRGSKKDFIDLLALHENGVSLELALDLFARKYGPAGKFLAIRSLSWFDDAEEEPDPLFLNGWTWPQVRSRMRQLAKSLLS